MMLNANGVAEIIATYQKHGWLLRRVLLTKESKNSLGPENRALPSDTEIVDSPIDAAWFSRPPATGGVAWEIRYLGDVPFALLEKVDENDPEFDKILSSVELRLYEAVAAKKSA